MALIFEWDTQKARHNLKKQGVSFEEATTACSDPLSVTSLTRSIPKMKNDL